MVWNVYIENINSRKIEVYNVFHHSSFKRDLMQLAKRRLNREKFEEELKRKVMYYFWSKAEWEVVITSWPPYVTPDEIARLNCELEYEKSKYGETPYVIAARPDVGEKVDVYDQLMLNWDLFVEYIWKRRKELRELAKSQSASKYNEN
jgi:hypothetical protein